MIVCALVPLFMMVPIGTASVSVYLWHRPETETAESRAESSREKQTTNTGREVKGERRDTVRRGVRGERVSCDQRWLLTLV